MFNVSQSVFTFISSLNIHNSLMRWAEKIVLTPFYGRGYEGTKRSYAKSCVWCMAKSWDRNPGGQRISCFVTTSCCLPRFLCLYNKGARLDVFLLQFLQPQDSLTLQVPSSQRAPQSRMDRLTKKLTMFLCLPHRVIVKIILYNAQTQWQHPMIQ